MDLPRSHNALVEIASRLPSRTIKHGDSPYLTKYRLTKLPNDAGSIYLHFFHRSDIYHELHSHPWSGRSVILTGGYREERRYPRSHRSGDPQDTGYEILWQDFLPTHENVVEPSTFHRVDLLDPEHGCWTFFSTGAAVEDWGFWDRNTLVYTPHEGAIATGEAYNRAAERAKK